MKVNLSLFSKMRSFIGFEIGHSGYLKKDDNGKPTLYRTMEIGIGFLFGWVTISFEYGGSVNLDEINKSLREEAMKGKIIK